MPCKPFYTMTLETQLIRLTWDEQDESSESGMNWTGVPTTICMLLLQDALRFLHLLYPPTDLVKVPLHLLPSHMHLSIQMLAYHRV
jgi:hypothetical protein